MGCCNRPWIRVKAFAEANVEKAGSAEFPFFYRHAQGGTFTSS